MLLTSSYSDTVTYARLLLSQRIIFESPVELASALRFIAADTSVAVARVLNDLDPARPARPLSGGYRGVVLCIVLRTPDTCRLGLDRHICEVKTALIMQI